MSSAAVRPATFLAEAASLGDTVAAPRTAFERIARAPRWFLAFAALVIMLVSADALQAPVMHRVAYLTQAHGYGQHPTADQEQELAALAEPSQTLDIVNWTVVTTVVVAALAGGAGLACLLAMAFGGRPSFLRFWSAFLNIAVPTLGLASLVSAALIFLQRDQYATYLDVYHTLPSALMLFPTTASPGLAAGLAAINPFAAWAAVLYVLAFETVGGLARTRAIVAAGILTALTVLLQAGVGAISGA